MSKRPISVTVIGWLFIAVGVVALTYHLLPQHIGELNQPTSVEHGLVLVFLIRVLAIVGGWFMLKGYNWARWLLTAWIVFHFILSFFHDLRQVVVHGLLFSVILFFLFRPQSAAYFRRGPPPPEAPDPRTTPAA
jgi:hypothetical protein